MEDVISYDDACELYLREYPGDRIYNRLTIFHCVMVFCRMKGVKFSNPIDSRFSEYGGEGGQGNHGVAVASEKEMPDSVGTQRKKDASQLVVKQNESDVNDNVRLLIWF